MRVGDFGVEVVPRGRGAVRETGTGHVLARPGQVYALRLRNYGPLRCVADVRIDGQPVTAGGLVIEAWSSEELERPISDDENGRFTVIAEGNEQVFGPDGGRDNAELGLIEVRFRRELPQRGDREHPRPLPPALFDLGLDRLRGIPIPSRDDDRGFPRRFEAIAAPWGVPPVPAAPAAPTRPNGELDDVERAAGTGLTGHSAQRFRPTTLGPLEADATVIQLRLVIGTEEAIEAARPLPEADTVPARPAARP